jgi:hypothetical protein
VGKTTKSDDEKRDDNGKAGKAPKPLGPATVLKPVLLGAAVLSLVSAVLPNVL